MIDTIIFDFGDIFINLDKQATPKAFKELGLQQWNSTFDTLNVAFETGKISRQEFLDGLQKQIPQANQTDILKAWNAILLDFPQHRLDFLVLLSKKYRLFLLSNTDAIHIEQFEKQSGEAFCSTFYKCFEKVYFSFDLGMRKPDLEIYKHLLDSHDLIPTNTLFVDDKKENTDAALKTGLQVWNLQVGTEDVVDLFEKINL
ncbi:HAD family phosphatase [Flavobacterium sp. FPG59]|jgi:putative hydrolase of the HAD superfamily|uniref:HAD family hydrolase n=1 Tax=Flavobacterium sp. FPG59 TaxID=1929267 RepID=UPI000A380C8C|nr:HAD family phosphatase [Flavobacterium sp. FPG59]OUD36403.1 haloacid dehalogenase [Flavobacterium sp. FPG59]